MKRVLFIGYVWPEPGSSAAGRRSMDLVHLFLEQGWQVDFASSAARSGHEMNLKTLGVAEHSVNLNCDSFDQFLSNLQPDVVIFDRYFTEEQFGWRVERTCPQALRVIDTIDLHCLREARQILAKGNEEATYSDFKALRSTLLKGDKTVREIAAIFRSDLSLMISDFEIEFLETQFLVPKNLLHLSTFMIDEVPKSFSGFMERQDFVSIGNFRHPPNWDSVLWLKQALWPKIREQMPKAQLKIYGAYPPAKAMELNNPTTGFQVLGWAENALVEIAKARVLLAPLRFGAGLKGKLFDALITGTPSVTTQIGSEGMCGKLPWGGFVGDTADELAQGAVTLYENKEAWLQAQDRGAKILQDRFLKQTQGLALMERIENLWQQRSELRAQNFIGTMLRHHQFQSTKHLSNWIALKNQMK